MQHEYDAPSPDVEAEALAWLAQLDGDKLTQEDLAGLREWMSRSPAHSAELRRLGELWFELNILTSMDVPIAEFDKLSRQMRRKSRFAGVRRWALVPACAAMALLAVGVFHNQIGLNVAPYESAQMARPVILSTQVGEQSKHNMPDGSSINLNTNSLVEIDYLDDQRRIRLLRGEAFFDVAHDEDRPFLVYAGDGIVRAVGTAFVVRLKSDNIDVLVSEGAVELSTILKAQNSADKVIPENDIVNLAIIKSGHKAEFSGSQAAISTISDDQILASLSWQEGLLTFSGESLQDVVSEVSRYTELNIQISDPTLEPLRIGGVFRSGDIEGLLSVLEANFGIAADQNEAGHIYLKRG